jgi:hypothetical protein
MQPRIENVITMIARAESDGHNSTDARERISYIKQMLAELSQVARGEGEELLVYLLEMAFTEAGDILAGKSVSTVRQVQRHQAARMAMKPAGKI